MLVLGVAACTGSSSPPNPVSETGIHKFTQQPRPPVLLPVHPNTTLTGTPKPAN